MMRTWTSLVFCMIVFGWIVGMTCHTAGATETDCDVATDAALLIKGSCESGTPLKFKMASAPWSKYRLFVELPDEPLPPPGTEPFCPPLSEDTLAVARGRMNSLGFRSVWWSIPDDPALTGRILRFWFATLERPGSGRIAISNPVETEICSDAEGDGLCEGGIRRLGYYTLVRYGGDFPVSVVTRAYGRNDPADLVGEISLEYDPSNGPDLPITTEDGGLSLTKIESFPGLIVLHCVAKGCRHANGRLPNETTFETEVGGELLRKAIHTSCSVPIGPGSRFKPLIITYLQDVASAPPGDCDD